MNKGWSFLAVLFAGATMLWWSSAALAFAATTPRIAAPKSFAADFTYQVGGNTPEQGRMFFSHGRIREEVTTSGAALKTVTIIDPLQKMIYVLDETKKNFKVLPWDARSALISEALRRFEKHKLVDTKVIDGQECEEFEILPKEKRNLKPFYLFVNKTTRFPVQLTTVDPDPSQQIHIKWTNLSPGYQSAILFDPPLGYAEVK